MASAITGNSLFSISESDDEEDESELELSLSLVELSLSLLNSCSPSRRFFGAALLLCFNRRVNSKCVKKKGETGI